MKQEITRYQPPVKPGKFPILSLVIILALILSSVSSCMNFIVYLGPKKTTPVSASLVSYSPSQDLERIRYNEIPYVDIKSDEEYSFGDLEKIEVGVKKISETVITQKDLLSMITPEFRTAITQMSERLNLDPHWILAIMHLESRFRSTARNKTTNASGLIQFMPSTARTMGYSVKQIRNMSAYDQLALVEKYLSNAIASRGPVHTASDCYLLVFYPKAVNQDRTFTIGGRKTWRQNKGLDTGSDSQKKSSWKKDGRLTVGDIHRYFYAKYNL